MDTDEEKPVGCSMSHNKGAEAPGVYHFGRTRSAFTIPCVPYDEAYTPPVLGISAELRCPNSLYSPEHEAPPGQRC